MGVCGMEKEVSSIGITLSKGEGEVSENLFFFFVRISLWMAPYSDFIYVNPIFCVIDKVKSYGKIFMRKREGRMTIN